jgi:hypothetical protein
MHTFLIAAAIFTFQNNFWVNLHQFMHAEAVRRAAGQRVQMDPALLDGYAPLAKRDVLRDAELVALNDALSRVTGDTLPSSIDPAIAAALMRAAPAYREQLWPQHRAANDAWIETTRPIADRLAPSLTEKLAAAYHTPWPSQPVLVDVAAAAGQFGAYTTNDGPQGFAGHATIASTDAANQGDMAVETIFHEASHTVDAAIMRMIADEARRQNLRASRLLWHAVIFYTTGELVRQALGKVGDSHYMPYAYRFDVYAKGMAADRPALERDWQPWLDGKVPFEEALRGLVRDAR